MQSSPRVTPQMRWQERLREAVRSSGLKHSIVALDAGIAPETLSRVLNATHASPSFRTVVRIVHATGHTVGWLLEEPGYSFAPHEVKQLRNVAAILHDATRDRGESQQDTVRAGV